ncbi:chromophore lyase CpcT/CpeT [Shewanella sp. 10N.7]|uniref:chromophore lyase CpcT/CpeT n=1 Tax=Shewanella sp. 10N.7 TaxID=2885093 RepID=UPI001E3FE5BC|nr:chromophore lyase CpcT/CpeT [Shewanella sp. 10N.7]MCC4833490.1 chromophore lyase CpcT/CpeT [Shewanella sp. 10N.7]
MNTSLSRIAVFSAFSALAFMPITSQATEQDKQALLLEWMQGHFDSEQQSISDKDFFNIHLNMVQIWPEDKSTWLYVEQAAATHLDKPYRQRVYEVTALSATEFASKVYTFENDKSFAGVYKDDAPLSELTPKDLTEKSGCTVFLTWSDKSQSFAGSTDKKSCLSKLRGASYATSEVTVTKDSIVSWDRGFDSNDKQVWGAEKAGYIFLKE